MTNIPEIQSRLLECFKNNNTDYAHEYHDLSIEDAIESLLEQEMIEFSDQMVAFTPTKKGLEAIKDLNPSPQFSSPDY